MAELKNERERASERKSGAASLAEFLSGESFREHFNRIIPGHLNSDRMHTIALRQLSTVPDLSRCSARSVAGAIMQAASLGLEIATLGECWLVPWENTKKDGDGNRWKEWEASLMIGYRGLLSLAWRSEKVAGLSFDYVMKGDAFEYQKGTDAYLHHVAKSDRSTDPRDFVAAYCVIQTTFGGHVFDVLDRPGVERIRQRAPSKNSPAWRDWYMEMAIGKVMKRTLKMGPQDRDVARAVSLDDEHDAGKPQVYDIDVPLLPEEAEKTEGQKAMERHRAASGGQADDGPAPMEIPDEPVDHREPVPVAAKKGGDDPEDPDKLLGF